MKNAAILAFVAAAAAQVTYNSTTGTYTCAIPGGAYCVDPSLGSPIIIRCDAKGVGSPGNCGDNLDGEPPLGDNPALCWETSATSGDAACEKNCVVYGGSGNYNGTFTLPADQCTPYYTASSSSSVASSTSTSSAASSSTTGSVGPTTVTTTLTTSTTVCSTSSGTGVSISTSSVPSNGTTTTASGSASVVTSATKTPVPPTTTTGVVTVPTAGAAVNSVGGTIALLGLAAAYLL